MIELYSMTWITAIIFAVIGMIRGWSTELVSLGIHQPALVAMRKRAFAHAPARAVLAQRERAVEAALLHPLAEVGRIAELRVAPGAVHAGNGRLDPRAQRERVAAHVAAREQVYPNAGRQCRYPEGFDGECGEDEGFQV